LEKFVKVSCFLRKDNDTMINAIIRNETGYEQPAEVNYLLAPDVVLLLIQDGTARLLDIDGDFYTISHTGAFMLQETLREGIVAAEHTIAEKYGVEVTHIHDDLQKFLHDLERKGLICRPKKTLSAQIYKASRGTIPFIILLPLLRCVQIWPASVKTKAWILLTLAYFSIRFFGWPRTVEVWNRSSGKNTPDKPLQEREQIVKAADSAIRVASVRHLLPTECKERALSCWTLLRFWGLSSKLIVGVDLFPLVSHCWCELGPTVLSDDEDRCERFIPILSYD
jgi:hypothetical protein